MKKIVALLVLLSLYQVISAQNPFEQFGHKGKILTATNGRFNEFHDLDSVVQIGSVLLDANKLVIVGEAPVDTVTYMPNPTVISRWLSPDPMSEKYMSWSPYNFAINNPILFVDPDGRDVNLGNLYEKDEDGKYKYQRQILAFELFASTGAGKKWVNQRAQSGFKLQGVFVKGLSIETKEAGSLSSKIDANFKVTDLDSKTRMGGGADGLTETEITDKGKLSITYNIDDDRANSIQEAGLNTPKGAEILMNSVDTYAHETMIHGFAKEQNFLSGKYKGMTGKIPPNGNAEHNYKFVEKTPYFQYIPGMLKTINDRLKLGVSDEKILKYRWRGNGE